jgi:hypothetical protein
LIAITVISAQALADAADDLTRQPIDVERPP